MKLKDEIVDMLESLVLQEEHMVRDFMHLSYFIVTRNKGRIPIALFVMVQDLYNGLRRVSFGDDGGISPPRKARQLLAVGQSLVYYMPEQSAWLMAAI